MGTTLTGTTPANTYDSLIKVTDNGPLSGTAKYLSDGLGNDSVLALSTAGVGIGTASPTVALEVDGAVKFSTSGASGPDLSFGNIGGSTFINNIAGARNYYGAYENVFTNGDNSVEFARITSAGDVGIGTDAPEAKVHIKGLAVAGSVEMFIENEASSTINNSADIFFGTWGGSTVAGITNARISAVNINAGNAESNLDFYTYNGASSGKRVSITQNGLTFNGDTAAANALDDYEEGNWTPSITFGGASVGITYSVTQGFYTKIGNQVTTTCYILLTNKGSSTGAARIEGLPFSINASSRGYSAPSFGALSAVSFSGQLQGYGNTGVATIDLVTTTLLGVQSALTNSDLSNATQIIMTFTYFV